MWTRNQIANKNSKEQLTKRVTSVNDLCTGDLRMLSSRLVGPLSESGCPIRRQSQSDLSVVDESIYMNPLDNVTADRE